MREIKFRVWDKETKQMSPEFSLFGEFTLMGAVHAWQRESAFGIGMEGYDDSIGRLNDLEIMQYTGLKDKNSKEIYEGDIIQLDEKNGSGEFPYDGKVKERIVKVIWSDFRASCTLWVSDFANDDLFRYAQYGNRTRVIGNIYEHPHLLKA